MSNSLDRAGIADGLDTPSVVPLSEAERRVLLASIDRQLAEIEQKMLDRKPVD